MKNYYVDRDDDEKIVGVFSRPQYKGQEFLPEESEEITIFNNRPIEIESTEQKIYAKMRQMAIEALKAEGALPHDFE